MLNYRNRRKQFCFSFLQMKGPSHVNPISKSCNKEKPPFLSSSIHHNPQGPFPRWERLLCDDASWTIQEPARRLIGWKNRKGGKAPLPLLLASWLPLPPLCHFSRWRTTAAEEVLHTSPFKGTWAVVPGRGEPPRWLIHSQQVLQGPSSTAQQELHSPSIAKT